MGKWTITYNRDNNTSKLEVEAADKPSMEEAVQYLLDMAERDLEQGEYGDGEDQEASEPAVLLLSRYGITVTGISQL